jgi:hypothetical protein
MISKHLGLQARRLEALAKAEAAAGHPETALDFYFQATALYGGAQHIIFETNDEKRYLYAGVRRCYDQVIALAPYRLEHVKGHVVMLLAEPGDLLRSTGFLPPKLVAREPQHHKAILAILVVEGLQAFVLGRIATLAGNIND